MPADFRPRRTLAPIYLEGKGSTLAGFNRMRERIRQDGVLAHKNRDFQAKVEVEWRRHMLSSLEQEFYSERDDNPVLFLSYTNTGDSLLSTIVKRSTQAGFRVMTWNQITPAKAVPISDGDEVTDSFIESFLEAEREELRGSVSDILSRIKRRIRDSSAFLGVWTHNFAVTEKAVPGLAGDERAAISGQAPGAWMLYEFGQAMALNKPVRLIVEKGMHPGFLDRILGFEEASMFVRDRPDEFIQVVEGTLDDLAQKVALRRI